MVWLKECTLCSDMDLQHLCMESETAGTNISLKFSLLLEPEPTRSLNSHRSFSCLESIRVSQLTKLHRRTLWLRLTTSEQMEENSEFIARNLEEVGQARSAANVRTKAQAEAMRKRNNFDETTPDYFFKVGDMVKMKHHDRLKLEFRWKGPYHVVDVGHPGTYWIMTPQGLRLPNAVNQNDLAPWLAPVVDNT
ncbi:hypothetical protein BASA81_017624 [Batrachochytrium salamandrivorans]|nr:hypothetical protein BASA81_017624 [Batrachochytrium salamandrivorans]